MRALRSDPHVAGDDGDGRHELILYATPTGRMAEACAAVFERLAAAPTSAQTYPPHCTLTGFFRRRGDRLAAIVAAAKEVIEDLGPLDPGAVRVVALQRTDSWLGLELDSPVLHTAIDRFVAAVETRPGDDALRPKDWLHLSLAYPLGPDVDHHALVAAEIDTLTQSIDPWELALWERRPDGAWIRHTRSAV